MCVCLCGGGWKNIVRDHRNTYRASSREVYIIIRIRIYNNIIVSYIVMNMHGFDFIFKSGSVSGWHRFRFSSGSKRFKYTDFIPHDPPFVFYHTYLLFTKRLCFNGGLEPFFLKYVLLFILHVYIQIFQTKW